MVLTKRLEAALGLSGRDLLILGGLVANVAVMAWRAKEYVDHLDTLASAVSALQFVVEQDQQQVQQNSAATQVNAAKIRALELRVYDGRP
jgi:hypothetical protein